MTEFTRWDTSGGAEIVDQGETVETCLQWPRIRDAKYIVASLCDTRAADEIRISYDFDRDGWKIEQPQRANWDADAPDAGDPKWLEVAFIKAWASNKDKEECEQLY